MFSRRTLTEIAAHTVLFAPLIVSEVFLFQYNIPRLVWLFATVFLFGLAFIVVRRGEYQASIKWIDVALASFVGIIWVSLLFAVEVYQGIWSSIGRNTGASTYLLVLVWYLLMRSAMWTQQEWRRLFNTTIVVTGIAAVWGILEYVTARIATGETALRISGPAGNSLIMANYLAPYLFVAAFMLSERVKLIRSSLHYYIVILIGILIVIATALTFSRSSYLGVIVGVICCAGYVWSLIKTGNHKRAFIYVGGALVAVVIVYGALMTAVGSNSSAILQRLSISRESFSTLQTRFLNWQIALNAIKERPIFGWGWENYRIAADKHFDPTLAEHSYYETRIDKPHNIFLEIWVTTGTVGLFIFLGLLYVVVTSIHRLKKNSVVSEFGSWILYGFLTAYIVQGFFAFETPQTLFGLAFILAFIASQDQKIIREITISQTLKRLLAGVFIVLMAWALIYVGWGAARTAYYIDRGLDAAAQNNFNGLDAAHRAAFKGVQGPYQFETWRWFAHALLYSYASGQASLSTLESDQLRRWNEDVDVIAALLKQHTAEHPHATDWQTFGGKIAYYIAIVRNDSAYLNVAEKLFMRAQEISPYRQESPLLLSYVYGLRGDHARALAAYQAAIRVSASVESTKARDFLIDVFVNSKDSARIVSILEMSTAVQTDADTYARLAAAYAAVGRYNDARTAVAEAVKRDPAFAEEAQAFLLTLPRK